jgi:hypothetical protein
MVVVEAMGEGVLDDGVGEYASVPGVSEGMYG